MSLLVQNYFGAPSRAFALLLITVATLSAGAAQAQSTARKTAQPYTITRQQLLANGATYVGMDACRTCHADVVGNFEKTAHNAINSEKMQDWQGKACEACHGPGSKHAESASPDDIVRPAHLAITNTDAICESCHLHQETQAGRIHSGHAHNEVSCIQCHSVHGTAPESLVARKPATVNKLCSGCHTSEFAQFSRPYAHRVSQNAMSCIDCHNPHGGFLPGNRQVFAANEPNCFRCHSDLRGPFPYEHAAVKLEGCMGCHEPHGSSNPRLLRRHLVRLVCLECHSNVNPPTSALANSPGHLGGSPPTFHNLTSLTFQNCTVCHVKVHGSYVDRFLER